MDARPRVGSHERGEYSDQGRLAGPVVAEHGRRRSRDGRRRRCRRARAVRRSRRADPRRGRAALITPAPGCRRRSTARPAPERSSSSALRVGGVVAGVVGEDGVELPCAERDVGGVDPHLVLDGVAAAIRFGHVVGQPGGARSGPRRRRRRPVGDLDAEVVERRRRGRVLEQDQLERRVGDHEVGVAGPLLGRLDAEQVACRSGLRRRCR